MSYKRNAMSTFAHHLGSFVEIKLVVGLQDLSFFHNAQLTRLD